MIFIYLAYYLPGMNCLVGHLNLLHSTTPCLVQITSGIYVKKYHVTSNCGTITHEINLQLMIRENRYRHYLQQ